MKSYKISIVGKTPYSGGRYHNTEKKPRETSEDFEERTWMLRMHTTEDGQVFIPPMAFKNCLSEAAKHLGLQVPGKGKRTYTKVFKRGLLVVEPALLGSKLGECMKETLFVSASGSSANGVGTRVMRSFPTLLKWKATFTGIAVDDAITLDVIKQHLGVAGSLIGLGRFRPENGGYYGMFSVAKIEELEAEGF